MRTLDVLAFIAFALAAILGALAHRHGELLPIAVAATAAGLAAWVAPLAFQIS